MPGLPISLNGIHINIIVHFALCHSKGCPLGGLEYKGNNLTATTFLDYLKTKDEINEALKLFIQDQCYRVDRMIKGDIVFFNYRQDILLGIYLGSGIVMCSFETYGIRKIKLRSFDIMETYRWV